MRIRRLPAASVGNAGAYARKAGPMARRRAIPAAEAAPGAFARWATPKHMGMAGLVAVLSFVALLGAFSPAKVNGDGSEQAATASVATNAAASAAAATNAPMPASSPAASQLGAAWGGSGGIDVVDLITKGGLVLVLLFITLRVLGRAQRGGGTRRTGRLNVLESRTLASKASLHLIAVGDRRLVVGLTPSGMVALAELDASEVDQIQPVESPAGSEAVSETAADSASGLGSAVRHPRSAQAPATQFAATLNALMAPIDGLTDRLAGFVSGGRAR